MVWGSALALIARSITPGRLILLLVDEGRVVGILTTVDALRALTSLLRQRDG